MLKKSITSSRLQYFSFQLGGSGLNSQHDFWSQKAARESKTNKPSPSSSKGTGRVGKSSSAKFWHRHFSFTEPLRKKVRWGWNACVPILWNCGSLNPGLARVDQKSVVRNGTLLKKEEVYQNLVLDLSDWSSVNEEVALDLSGMLWRKDCSCQPKIQTPPRPQEIPFCSSLHEVSHSKACALLP
jgi:hypothetical protein